HAAFEVALYECVPSRSCWFVCCFFFQAEDGIRDFHVTGVQTCALPILCWSTCPSRAYPLCNSLRSPFNCSSSKTVSATSALTRILSGSPDTVNSNCCSAPTDLPSGSGK